MQGLLHPIPIFLSMHDTALLSDVSCVIADNADQLHEAQTVVYLFYFLPCLTMHILKHIRRCLRIKAAGARETRMFLCCRNKTARLAQPDISCIVSSIYICSLDRGKSHINCDKQALVVSSNLTSSSFE